MVGGSSSIFVTLGELHIALDLLDDLADFPIGKSTIYGGIYGEHVFFGGVGSLRAVDDNFSVRNG